MPAIIDLLVERVDPAVPWVAAVGAVIAAAVLGVLLARARAGRRRAELARTRLRHDFDRLEQRYFQARKMESVGNLAGSVIHSFNNLLAVMIGHVRLLRDEPTLPAATRDDLDQAIKAGHVATELVRELSTFYRQADIRRKPVRLQQPLREIVTLLSDLVPANVQVVHNLDPACGPVLASTTQVQQIVMNLASNAVNALYRRRGRIEIDLAEVQVEEPIAARPHDLRPGPHARLSIRDTGSGMDEQTLARMFEPYFTGERSGKNIGLGLNTVYRILADHDGATIPHSRPGEGTRFDIYFPVIAWSLDRAEPAPAAREAEAAPARPPRVMLVDDEAMVARVTGTHLERRGYDVSVFTEAQAALDAFRADPRGYDLLVTDQIMTPISGIRLAREVLAVRPDLPVILASGFRGSFNEERARRIGIRSFVIKPVSYAELSREIDRLLADAAAREA
ncbi:MAG: response regulator [Candidatus Krumholzibacteriia bacterium]